MKVQTTSKGAADDPSAVKEPIFNQWDEFVKDYLKDAPASMKSLDQNAGPNWAFIPTE